MDISTTNFINQSLFSHFKQSHKVFFKQLYSSMKPPSIHGHIFPKSWWYQSAWVVSICIMYCHHIVKRYSFHCSLATVSVLPALLSLGLGRMYPMVLLNNVNHTSLLLIGVLDRLITAAITTAKITIIWLKYTTGDLWQILSMTTLFWSTAKTHLQYYM